MSEKKHYYVPAGSPVYPNLFDTRVRLRSLTLGLLKPEELEKHLAELPDESANADFVEFNSIVEDSSEEVAEEVAVEAPVEETSEFAMHEAIMTQNTASAESSSDVNTASNSNEQSATDTFITDMPIIEPIEAAPAPVMPSEIPEAIPAVGGDEAQAETTEIPTVIPPSDAPDFE